MKNVLFFVVLAILTVAALVGWNAVRTRTTPQITQEVSESPTPTSSVGTAVGRSLGLGTLGTATDSGSTKGGDQDTNSAVIPVASSSGAVVPTSTPKPTTSMTQPVSQQATTIIYSDNGFTPKTLTVTSGTMVKFLNSSSKRMQIVSAEVAGGKKIDSMNMSVSVGKDGFYEFQFTNTGTWGFINQENQSQNGTVVVN